MGFAQGCLIGEVTFILFQMAYKKTWCNFYIYNSFKCKHSAMKMFKYKMCFMVFMFTFSHFTIS